MIQRPASTRETTKALPKLAKPDLFSPAPTGKPEEAAGAAHAEL